EPQHILPVAYHKLQLARYPLTLPFDLWIETVRRFLGHFDISLSEVLEIFRSSDDLFVSATNAQPHTWADIFAETLGLSPPEYAIFIDPGAFKSWFALYGYEKDHDAITALASAKTLSRRLSVTYKDLVKVVTTGFVNPGLNGV